MRTLIALTLAALVAACASFDDQPDMVGVRDLTARRIDDVLLSRNQPTPESLRDAEVLGVRTVICLLPDDELRFDEATMVRSLGMDFVHIPVTKTTLDDDKANHFLVALSQAERPILVHCRSGNRVGALWALERITQGMPTSDALDEARAVGLRSPQYEAFVYQYLEREAEHLEAARDPMRR